MQKKIGGIIAGGVYLILGTLMFYMPTQHFFLGGIGVEYRYLFGIGIFLLGVIHFLFSARLPGAVRLLSDGVALLSPYLWSLLYSLLFWVISGAATDVFTRGIGFIFYQVIAVLAAVSVVYMFGTRGIYLQMGAMLLAMALTAVDQIRLHGAGPFFQWYFSAMLTFTRESGPAMSAFEKLGMCYPLGLLISYFALTLREKKHHLVFLVVAVLAFFLGLKRSVFFSVFPGILAGTVLLQMKKPKKLLLPIAVICVGAMLGYVALVHGGLFDYLETLGMDSKGRDWLYRELKDLYQLSPVYMGRGAGYVASSFDEGVIVVSSHGYSIKDIHNDYLRQYIELGFFGFVIWAWLTVWTRGKHFFRYDGDPMLRRRGVIALMLILQTCITYMTENALYHYYATIFLAVIILGHRAEDMEARTMVPEEMP